MYINVGMYAAVAVAGSNSKAVRCCLAQQQGPDLSLLSPRLRQEWDYGKNQHLDNVLIKPYSHKVCAWICPEGTADDPHHWETEITTRTKGHGCPYCAGVKVSKRNSLAIVAPDVAKSWCYKQSKGTTNRTRALHMTILLKAITRQLGTAQSAATNGVQHSKVE